MVKTGISIKYQRLKSIHCQCRNALHRLMNTLNRIKDGVGIKFASLRPFNHHVYRVGAGEIFIQTARGNQRLFFVRHLACHSVMGFEIDIGKTQNNAQQNNYDGMSTNSCEYLNRESHQHIHLIFLLIFARFLWFIADK